MSGTGKSTVLIELARRGHRVQDTDYGGWVLPDGTWDEPRMWAFLNSEDTVVVSGTVENQTHFYTTFRHVVLLSAPLPVLLERVQTRLNNPTAGPMSSRTRPARTYETLSRFCGRPRRSNSTPKCRSRPWRTRSRHSSSWSHV